ncbi:MAG TPA: hypothetical protein VH372_26745 [Actinospica sp.]|jgi:hypothetical protein|nr:hypothetical protein [Actinospica sp.]
MTPQDYMNALVERLRADGDEPQWDTTGAPYLLGHRSDFKVQWMATRIHLFTVAAVVPEVTLAGLEQFADFALDVAVKRKKGLPRGLQTGIAAFPTLISDRVEPAALQRAAKWQKTRFAVMGRPTVVDTANRAVGAYRGRPLLGLMYAGYLRQKSELYFPQPD